MQDATFETRTAGPTAPAGVVTGSAERRLSVDVDDADCDACRCGVRFGVPVARAEPSSRTCRRRVRR